MPISLHVKEACKLTDSILTAVAIAQFYSKEAKALTAQEVRSIINEEEEVKVRAVLQSYLELLEE